MNVRTPIPLRPDPNAIAERAVTSLMRAVIASARMTLDRNWRPPWDDDRAAELITRAAVPPLATSDMTALAHVAIAFVASLVGASAAAALIARSLRLSFDGAATIGIPALTLPHASFVGEKAPIPVVMGTSSAGATLTPFKLAVIVPLSGEMIRNSNAEAFVRQVLIENVGPSLDAAMLSNAAAVPGLRPPGILHGITAIPAATGGGLNAMVTDIGALAQAVAPVMGNGQAVLIAAPAQATAYALLAERDAFPMMMANALAPGTVVIVATQALATVIDVPSIESSTEAAVHMDDQPGELVDSAACWRDRSDRLSRLTVSA
jgi:hypothetical protein